MHLQNVMQVLNRQNRRLQRKLNHGKSQVDLLNEESYQDAKKAGASGYVCLHPTKGYRRESFYR